MIVILSSFFVSSLNINEVEQNPEGSDSGNEWVEIYSSESVNLEDYFLENGDGDVYNLTGILDGFLVIEFKSQWLDNKNETVYLKKDGGIVDEIKDIDDSENNGRSWQNCDGSWDFLDNTRGEENSCEAMNNNPSQTSNKLENKGNGEDENPELDHNLDDMSDNDNPVVRNLEGSQASKNQKIVLNSPSLESEEDKKHTSKNEKVRRGVIYSFVLFCVVLIILLALRKL
jgi:hypothetical protein